MPREKQIIVGDGLTARLKRLKISEARYAQELECLKNKGYSDREAQTVILRAFSKKTVEVLLALHDSLIAKEFTRAEIVIIAGHDGGSRNLEAVLKNAQALIDLGFPCAEIVKIAGHGGGSHNLEAVLEHQVVLKQFGFDAAQIVSMVSHDGGSRNLAAVLEHQVVLKQFEFDAAQIVSMVSHHGGSRNLAALSNAAHEAGRLGFSLPLVYNKMQRDALIAQLGVLSAEHDAQRAREQRDILHQMIASPGAGQGGSGAPLTPPVEVAQAVEGDEKEAEPDRTSSFKKRKAPQGGSSAFFPSQTPPKSGDGDSRDNGEPSRPRGGRYPR